MTRGRDVLNMTQMELQQHSSFTTSIAAQNLKGQTRPFDNYYLTGKSAASRQAFMMSADVRAITYSQTHLIAKETLTKLQHCLLQWCQPRRLALLLLQQKPEQFLREASKSVCPCTWIADANKWEKAVRTVIVFCTQHTSKKKRNPTLFYIPYFCTCHTKTTPKLKDLPSWLRKWYNFHLLLLHGSAAADQPSILQPKNSFYIPTFH